MKTVSYLWLLILLVALILTGCQGPRTEPVSPSVVQQIGPTNPIEPGPPGEAAKDPFIFKPESPQKPVLPAVKEQALVCNAKLDLLRVFICSDETVNLSNSRYKSDECRQKVTEHFTDMGYRIVEETSPGYDVSGNALTSLAEKYDVDLFVLLKADVKQTDKFGDYFLYEADGRGRVAQIVGNELVTTTSANVRGKRALNEQGAAQSALQACAQEIGQKLSYEIIRKSSTGILVRELVVDGLERAEQADYVRVGLSEKPGIQSVSLKKWDNTSKRAVFLIRLDASVKENLASYLENINNVRLKVKKFDETKVKSREKAFWEIF
jgi:hypothetical protein